MKTILNFGHLEPKGKNPKQPMHAGLRLPPNRPMQDILAYAFFVWPLRLCSVWGTKQVQQQDGSRGFSQREVEDCLMCRFFWGLLDVSPNVR